MKEKHYDRLRAALDRLPDYAPPASAWKGISRELSPVSRLNEKLPTYAPPPAVWNAVSHELAKSPAPATRLRQLRPKLIAAAAAVALIVTAGIGYANYDAGPKISYAYAQEANPVAVSADWDDDEASFDRARQEVEQRNEPRLNNLGHELDELTSAREEVKAMLVAYGSDPSVVRQLAEIERERDDVYRRIIVEL
ncbi:hypothetical protein GGR28_003253 [Lewinella aquimaris]|uniref:Uncharacterized protein n=1 Tax=Neolewinella aquimaris TaxID=1835722 RepID=A0A840EFA8_9BACT|nr:hypothetical protein [Neolewinella aquimaris]MBB4080618.1 hypothetical protein [Neolewinella aquimaris]